MCDMRRNGRCRTSRHYMERCSFIRAFFCGQGAEIRKKQAETYTLVKRQEEEHRLAVLWADTGILQKKERAENCLTLKEEWK